MRQDPRDRRTVADTPSGGGPRPRIAHVISTRGVGGAERTLAAVVAGAAARGWDQIVLNPFAAETSRSFAALCAAPYQGYPCDRVVELPRLRRWLQSELDRFQPDIVHVVLFHSLAVTATFSRRAGTSWVLTRVYDHTHQLRPHSRAREVLDRWAGHRFDKIVVPSESVGRFLVTRHGHPESRIVRISPGWEGESLPANRDDSRPTIVCVANLRPEKGHQVLLAAFQEVRREIPEARLLLVGDGDLAATLKALVASSDMAGSVEFAGRAESVWPALARAHVFALASLTEAWGIAMVEAMAAGLPVVAPAVGGIPEVVRPGVWGELFPAGDHVALARHLVRLLRAPDLRERMGSAGREAAATMRMEDTVDRYLALYTELLQERNGSLR